ncbi:hypothetical protein GYA93_14385 [Gordonia desulfuricans]|uniref:Uncharacterized protein n=1 Tax=Gordonia desulfuricans TaxID=89051 RepID=A0A7K3LRC8_9ACTN|nr:hypothetical protein [Gordonia desulfuricans]NDK90760.1 hypothetical protein [Gordonia desulfuricans]
MTALTVFLAPSGPADGVLAALTDLSAAGLVDQFAWVTDPDTATPVQSLVVVERGIAHDLALTELVTTRRITLLRICSVVPIAEGTHRLPVGAELGVTRALHSATGAAQVVRIRVALTGPAGIDGPSTALSVEGWHNVVVSPEDSRGPEFGRIPTPTEPTSIDHGRFAGPVIAGLTGLWSGIEHAPLDDAPVLPGKVIRLARSFYRKLETADVESSLRAEILAQDGRLPLPSDQRMQVVYLQDAGLAGRTMASTLWTKHSAVLRGTRLSYPTQTVETIGAWAAIKMFLGFLWASIKNAPAAWYHKVAGGLARSVAIGVQQAVFTDAPAAYEVVAHGRRANGQHAGWADIGEASDHLGGLITGTGPVHDAGTDLSGLWQDYARASMTLADAGNRTSDLPPVPVGAAVGIVHEAAGVVPGPGERFTAIPGVIGAATEIDGVDAVDALGVEDLRRRLGDLQRDPHNGLAAGSTLSALNDWQRRHSGSFGAAVGDQLAKSFAGCWSEVQGLFAKLMNAQTPPDPGSRNLGLARWVQVAVVLWLILTGVFTYLAIAEIVDWWVAPTVIVGTLIVLVVALGCAFISTQRRLFALLHQRKSVIAEHEIDLQNLRAALNDLRRLSQAYGQFLAWSRVIGGFLAAPLGPDLHRPEQVLHISRGMPMSTSVGVARPAEAEIATIAGHLRRDLFRPGWLTRSWEDLITRAAPPQPGARDLGVGASPLWSERGRRSGSQLDRFSTAVHTGAVTSSGADVVWQHALDLLAGPMGTLVPRLLASVQPIDRVETTIDEFLGGIDRPTEPSGSFSTDLLTDGAIMDAVAKVDIDYRRAQRWGLGIICAATQLSDAFTADHLVTVGDQTPRADTDWAAPQPIESGFGVSRNGQDPTGAPGPATRPDEFRAPEPGRGFEF